MCLAKSCLSALNAASTFSDNSLSACSCAWVLGGADAHAAMPHNSAAATYGTRFIIRDTLLASCLCRCDVYHSHERGRRPHRGFAAALQPLAASGGPGYLRAGRAASAARPFHPPTPAG